MPRHNRCAHIDRRRDLVQIQVHFLTGFARQCLATVVSTNLYTPAQTGHSYTLERVGRGGLRLIAILPQLAQLLTKVLSREASGFPHLGP